MAYIIYNVSVTMTTELENILVTMTY